MHSRLLSKSKPDTDSSAEWNEVVRLTVEALRHRSEGLERIAMRILQERLPTAIRAWSIACGDTPNDCKERLRTLFTRVGDHVATEALQRRIIRENGLRGASGSVRRAETGKFGLTERIRIDDVSGMLDALADAEAESAALQRPMNFKMPVSRFPSQSIQQPTSP